MSIGRLGDKREGTVELRRGDCPMHTVVGGRKGDGDGRHAATSPVSTSACMIETTGRSALVALSPTGRRSSAIGDKECLELE